MKLTRLQLAEIVHAVMRVEHRGSKDLANKIADGVLTYHDVVERVRAEATPRVAMWDAKGYEERLKLVDEMERLFDLIVAEFESDPMSVQCFDLRIVERAKYVNALMKANRARSGL